VTIQGIDLDELTLTNFVNVYPNPNDGHFNLNFELKSEQEAELVIINALGQTMLNRKLGTVSIFNDAIDLSTHAKGMYILQIKLADGVISKRVTVQ